MNRNNPTGAAFAVPVFCEYPNILKMDIAIYTRYSIINRHAFYDPISLCGVTIGRTNEEREK